MKLDPTNKINEYCIKEKNYIIKLYLENFGKNKKINDNNINFDEVNEIIDEKFLMKNKGKHF